MSGLRKHLAGVWLLVGRCLLVGSIGGYLFLILGSQELAIPTWLESSILVLLAVTSSLLPLLLLPVASPATCVWDGETLKASTVLGWRMVSIPRVQLWFELPARGIVWDISCVKGERGYLIVIDSSVWDEDGFDPDWVDPNAVPKDGGAWLGYVLLVSWMVVGAALLLGLLALLNPVSF